MEKYTAVQFKYFLSICSQLYYHIETQSVNLSCKSNKLFSWVKTFKQKKGFAMPAPKAQRQEVANVIQKLRLIFLSLSISGIVKAGSNTFYKYEYKYKICVLCKTQTGYCK